MCADNQLETQMFNDRSLMARVIMAKFDLSALKDLDEKLSELLGDMTVSCC